MASAPSAPKVILLATHFATNSDIDSLTSLAAQQNKVLPTELLLRILLTCLPSTLESSEYAPLVKRIELGSLDDEPQEVDWSSVEHFTDEEASQKLKKLRLLPLLSPSEDAVETTTDDLVSRFLISRARRVDDDVGLLTQLPALIVPFLDHAPCIRTWLISVLLPLLRRNNEYYPHAPMPQTLAEFEGLPDRVAVSSLLKQTGTREEDWPFIGRDLRCLIMPWLYSERRWIQKNKHENGEETEKETEKEDTSRNDLLCPGWEQMLEWITFQASKSWRVAVKAFDQWDGPEDVDLGGYGSMWLGDEEESYLERRYARAALASAYLVPEASVDALTGVNVIITKIMALLNQDPCPTLQVASSLLPPLADADTRSLVRPRNATFMRNDMLEGSNLLTAPNVVSAQLLQALTLSAYIITKAGGTCTVRRAGELAFIQDENEQKVEALKFLGNLNNDGPRPDDRYWIRMHNEIMWLRDWGSEETSDGSPASPVGVFGQLKKEFLEVECLKAFLTNARYALARSVYEDSSERPLNDKVLEDTIVAAAMSAYDNASNPNRTRGGLLRCDDILHAFPKTVPEKGPAAQKIDALLKATHGLSEYRLALKQGEPFTPVVLRVHSDPISIIGKLLEQNPKSYTRVQDFLEIGNNMVNAGLTVKPAKLGKPERGKPELGPGEMSLHRELVQKRVIAMSIDAALTEDDFETAYSFVAKYLASARKSTKMASVMNDPGIPGTSNKPVASTKTAPDLIDEYSWKAALQAGKYRRTARTVRPTHIGSASSGNLDIRHLEQRLECLSTALRIAPPATLQEILNVFRRCEEELDAAIKTEEAQDAAWDERAADIGLARGPKNSSATASINPMPGAFSSTVPAGVVKHNSTASATRSSAASRSRHQDEAPMSLFDLSRASMARAQLNLSALSGLQRSGQARRASGSGEGGGGGDGDGGWNAEDSEGGGGGGGQTRTRKRDQLREAAVGTLASGVGWLIGAQPPGRTGEKE